VSALVIDKAGNVYAGTARRRRGAAAAQAPVAPPRGRPESEPAGIPIARAAARSPSPPKVPDPNPGQPDPIPKAAPSRRRRRCPSGAGHPAGPCPRLARLEPAEAGERRDAANKQNEPRRTGGNPAG
jgi:hypothetical protein